MEITGANILNIITMNLLNAKISIVRKPVGILEKVQNTFKTHFFKFSSE